MTAAEIIKVLNVTALVAVMFSLGMKVRFAEVWAAARRVRALALALFANFVLVPLISVTLLHLFQAPPLAAAGFLILAVCPGAPVGPAFTAIAKGDVPLATGFMVILAAASAILAPVLLTLLLGWLSTGSQLTLDYQAIAKVLLVTQLLPLAAGLGFHNLAPRAADRLAWLATIFANALLFAVVVLIVATQYQTFQAFRLRGWFGMLLLLAATLGAGWLCGGREDATKRALIITTGLRNAAVALVIVTANFAGTPAQTAVIVYALVSIFGTLAVALLLGKFSNTGE